MFGFALVGYSLLLQTLRGEKLGQRDPPRNLERPCEIRENAEKHEPLIMLMSHAYMAIYNCIFRIGFSVLLGSSSYTVRHLLRYSEAEKTLNSRRETAESGSYSRSTNYSAYTWGRVSGPDRNAEEAETRSRAGMVCRFFAIEAGAKNMH